MILLAFSVHFLMGRDVNGMTLPLNCLPVVLITALIDAEIKQLPQARRGAKKQSTMGKGLS